MKSLWMTAAALAALLFHPASAVAGADPSCGVGGQVYGAEYRIRTIAADSQESEPDILRLVRGTDRVMHVYPATGRADLWERNSRGGTHFTRYYDDAARGIEFYQGNPAEPRSQMDWDRAWQLVPSAILREHSPRDSRRPAGCFPVEDYAYTVRGAEHHLRWLPGQALIQRLEIRAPEATRVWELTALVTGDDAFAVEQSHRADYVVIDFADLGDQESDPFFRSLTHDGVPAHGHH
ncbi:hypothetical protein [Parahaliea mediterranea]|uniref:DUF3108 domain-containing protein n=1 Tax=Parahaliea mediterranea TaxID=651086 RepID=A0A939DDF6_9GAMM|nr:hypothetical protein [Parahaliea mediterranea]MBN7796153.1 hypothetical protein [Parahaliea mediterranea]